MDTASSMQQTSTSESVETVDLDSPHTDDNINPLGNDLSVPKDTSTSSSQNNMSNFLWPKEDNNGDRLRCGMSKAESKLNCCDGRDERLPFKPTFTLTDEEIGESINRAFQPYHDVLDEEIRRQEDIRHKTRDRKGKKTHRDKSSSSSSDKSASTKSRSRSRSRSKPPSYESDSDDEKSKGSNSRQKTRRQQRRKPYGKKSKGNK